ncbi:hypothetical protein PIB30_043288 [Stylosanthes scabra]|uniref:Transmembrane protein n=1 Tax=Stylosanthes scabra TaxID=79078 RepID=A0ABU6XDA6_9FABA|nr:hypothetical protein [Stylosanthes scabra]
MVQLESRGPNWCKASISGTKLALRSLFVFMVVAALLLSITLAQTSATTPAATPHKKSKHHLSHAVSPAPAVSPSAEGSPPSLSVSNLLPPFPLHLPEQHDQLKEIPF